MNNINTVHAYIVKALADAPEAWTPEQLELLKTATGEAVTIDELRTQRDLNESTNMYYINAAIDDNMRAMRDADFDDRLKLLTTEVIPAVKFAEEQEKRLGGTNE